MDLTGEGYELHFLAGLIIMGAFFFIYYSRLMWFSEALMLGALSMLVGAYAWEIFWTELFNKKFDGIDVMFSLLGAVIPLFVMTVHYIAEYSIRNPNQKTAFADNEREFMMSTLSKNKGSVMKSAEQMGVTIQTIYRIMNKHQITMKVVS